ncbi:MAG: sigma 54-interacting transcriptional regulator, partial [Pseudomonadota bacterium]
REWVLRFSSSPEFLEVDPEGAIALDGSGRIVGRTHGAQDRLGSSGGKNLIGECIENLLDLTVDELPNLTRGRPSEERVLRLRDGSGLFGHAIAPQNVRHVRARRQPDLPGPLSVFAGPDPSLQSLLRLCARLAHTRTPLLVLGETGTGKETLARAIHSSGSAPGAFHALRCAGTVEEKFLELMDAAAGTLFLRGVEDLDDGGQTALLTLLETRRDLRLIASSSDPRTADPATSPLRMDLHFRVVGGLIPLPPLRIRQDFDWLLDRLLQYASSELLRLSPAARAELTSRKWPGNVRELEATIDIAVALCDGAVVDLHDLPVLPGGVASSVEPEEDLEALLIACDWNMAQAARRLGVNRSTILRRVRKVGLVPPS